MVRAARKKLPISQGSPTQWPLRGVVAAVSFACHSTVLRAFLEAMTALAEFQMEIARLKSAK
jgi:hypothetical protein